MTQEESDQGVLLLHAAVRACGQMHRESAHLPCLFCLSVGTVIFSVLFMS